MLPKSGGLNEADRLLLPFLDGGLQYMVQYVNPTKIAVEGGFLRTVHLFLETRPEATDCY